MIAARYAWAFLTRLPGGQHPDDASGLGRSVPWFPVVGAVIGLVVDSVYVGLSELVSPLLAGFIAVIAGVFATGAFHEDGLADTFDAMGGMTVERRLEIMRDSRIGTFGTLALIASVGIRATALAAVLPINAWIIVPLAHAAGRAAALVLMLRMRPAQADGLGVSYLSSLPRTATTVIVAGVAGAAVATGPLGWVLVVIAATVTMCMAGLLRARFGGMSGDGLGATEQIVEMAVLVTAAAIGTNGLGWAA